MLSKYDIFLVTHRAGDMHKVAAIHRSTQIRAYASHTSQDEAQKEAIALLETAVQHRDEPLEGPERDCH